MLFQLLEKRFTIKIPDMIVLSGTLQFLLFSIHVAAIFGGFVNAFKANYVPRKIHRIHMCEAFGAENGIPNQYTTKNTDEQ